MKLILTFILVVGLFSPTGVYVVDSPTSSPSSSTQSDNSYLNDRTSPFSNRSEDTLRFDTSNPTRYDTSTTLQRRDITRDARDPTFDRIDRSLDTDAGTSFSK